MATSDVIPLGWRNWANLLAYVVNLGLTYSSLTGLFGKTNTDLSAKYQTLVTPAGYAFSIWGPIFIWEGVFAASQMFPQLRSNSVITSMTPWWIAACVFQCCWTIAFAREWIFISFWCMLGILLSLLGGILRTDLQPYSNKEFWLLRAPFSLHGGGERKNCKTHPHHEGTAKKMQKRNESDELKQVKNKILDVDPKPSAT